MIPHPKFPRLLVCFLGGGIIIFPSAFLEGFSFLADFIHTDILRFLQVSYEDFHYFSHCARVLYMAHSFKIGDMLY